MKKILFLIAVMILLVLPVTYARLFTSSSASEWYGNVTHYNFTNSSILLNGTANYGIRSIDNFTNGFIFEWTLDGATAFNFGVYEIVNDLDFESTAPTGQHCGMMSGGGFTNSYMIAFNSNQIIYSDEFIGSYTETAGSYQINRTSNGTLNLFKGSTQIFQWNQTSNETVRLCMGAGGADTIYDVNWTNGTARVDIFNITFYDEILDTIITGDEITVEVVSDNHAQNYSTTTGIVSITSWVDGEYRLTYDADEYGKRSHYRTIGNTSNDTYFSSSILYMLSNTNGTDVTFTVQDNSGNELANATIYLKKYFVATNSYRTVAMARTNEEGNALIDVDYNDAYYQILVTYKDFSLQTIGTKIISLTRILTMDLIPDPFTNMDIIDGITTSLTFNNLTETFSYSFTDTTGADRKGLLEVWKLSPTSNSLMCNNTDISSSSTLLCKVNTTNSTGTYTAKGFIQVGSYDTSVLMEMMQVITGLVSDLKQKWGVQGVFFTILVAGALAGLGAVVSPAVAIIMFLVGIMITNFFGMTLLSASIIGFLILIGLVMIYNMKK